MDNQEVISLFCKSVDDLKQLEFCKDPKSVQTRLNIKVESPGGPRIVIEVPSQDVIGSYLMALRKFYMQKEPTWVLRIIGIAMRIEAPQAFKEIVEIVKNMYLQTLKVSPIGLCLDKKEYTPKNIIDVYFNGELFHSDEKKMAELAKIRRSGLEKIFYFDLITATGTIYSCITILNAALRSVHEEDTLDSMLKSVKDNLVQHPLGRYIQISAGLPNPSAH